MYAEKGAAVFVIMALLGLLLHSNTAHAASYTVGDSTGWRFNVAGWENDKQFKAGDTLVFNYSSTRHSVVAVDEASYNSCNVPANAPMYNSGNDKITLKKGANYFICGVPGHCQAGMKIAAIAA